jgi:uncharacterized DUF497 family protein
MGLGLAVQAFRTYNIVDGHLGRVAYRLVATHGNGGLRAISLRRARAKEMKRYAP